MKTTKSSTERNEVRHTPTPWHIVSSAAPFQAEFGIMGPKSAPIGNILGQGILKNKENAEFIIRVVNSHEELIKIAQAYRNLLRTMTHTEGEVATYHHIESVLAQAEGK